MYRTEALRTICRSRNANRVPRGDGGGTHALKCSECSRQAPPTAALIYRAFRVATGAPQEACDKCKSIQEQQRLKPLKKKTTSCTDPVDEPLTSLASLNLRTLRSRLQRNNSTRIDSKKTNQDIRLRPTRTRGIEFRRENGEEEKEEGALIGDVFEQKTTFFVYDSASVVREEDDPNDAVVFFHPVQTCAEDRCNLCCQVVGVSRFFAESLAAPTTVDFARGRFALQQRGPHIFALGTSSKLPFYSLENRLKGMVALLEFFYRDVKRLQKQPVLKQRRFFATILELAKHLSKPHIQTTMPVTTSKNLERIKNIGRKFDSVIGSCTYVKDRVALNDLGEEFARVLGLISGSSSVPQDLLETLQVSYQTPPGTSLVRVYLKPDVYRHLLTTKTTMCGDFKVLRGPKFDDSEDSGHEGTHTGSSTEDSLNRSPQYVYSKSDSVLANGVGEVASTSGAFPRCSSTPSTAKVATTPEDSDFASSDSDSTHTLTSEQSLKSDIDSDHSSLTAASAEFLRALEERAIPTNRKSRRKPETPTGNDAYVSNADSIRATLFVQKRTNPIQGNFTVCVLLKANAERDSTLIYYLWRAYSNLAIEWSKNIALES